MRLHGCGAACLAALLVSACSEQQTGYVEVRLTPSLQMPVILLDSQPIRPTRGGSMVVKRKVGAAKLEVERRKDERVTLCDVTVRKDRITTVTLTPQGGTLRCAIEAA